MLLIPCYRGDMKTRTAVSLMENMVSLTSLGYVVKISHKDGCCFPCEARNQLIDTFLTSDCDTAMFIDDDISFPANAISLILASDNEIVGGAYPIKSEMQQYPMQIALSPIDGAPIRCKDLIGCKYLPTGFMKIKKSVFKKLAEKYPDNVHNGKTSFFREYYWPGFHGEDLYFCRLCRDAGIDIWLYPDIDFGHCGEKWYTGNFSKHIKGD